MEQSVKANQYSQIYSHNPEQYKFGRIKNISLPHDNILAWSKFNSFSDDKINLNEKLNLNL